jgi:hypothetical protein
MMDGGRLSFSVRDGTWRESVLDGSLVLPLSIDLGTRLSGFFLV